MNQNKIRASVRLALLTAAAAAAGSLVALPAAAQDQQQPAADASGLDEIIVTARFREESLQETPIAITAISADEIAAQGITNASEIAYDVPNASFRPAGAAFGNTMTAYIRGIGQYDFLPEFEPGVAIYFDDTLHPVTMGSMIDLMDLERVEVLRGPQGTLFGRGAIGGAVRFVSKQPQGDGSGAVQVTVGDFDRVDMRAAYDFGITDNVAVRVTGMSKKRDGHQTVYDFACRHPDLAGTIKSRNPNREKNCKIGTQGGEDVSGGRVALRYSPSDDFAMTLIGDYMDDNSEARADTLMGVVGPNGPFATWSQFYLVPNYGVPFDDRFVPDTPFESYATYGDDRSGLQVEPAAHLEQKGASVKFDYSFSDSLRLELIGSWRSFRGLFATDADQSPFNEQTVDGKQSFTSRTGELRLSGTIAEKVHWTGGLFYYDGDFTNGQIVSIPAFIFGGVFNGTVAALMADDPGLSLEDAQAQAAPIAAGVIDGPARTLVNGLNKTSSVNQSAFLHTDIDITDALQISLGARYSIDDKREQFDNSIVVTRFPLEGGDPDQSHFDWKAGIKYKFNDQFMAYASASTGYRPQAFNPRPFQPTQFIAVDGEEATSYELGIKSDLLDNRVRVNLAGFYIDYNQRIVPQGGTECTLLPGGPPYEYDTVPAGTPGAVTDSLGNICLATTSRTFYLNSPGTIKGIELEVAVTPFDGFNISGQYGLTKFSADDLNGLLNGDRPVYVPEDNWSVSLAYEGKLANGSTLTPRVDVFGQSEICSQATTASSCAPGYDLVNARVEWVNNEDREWVVAVGATNLTDKQYWLNIFDLSAFGQPTIEGQPGRPREYFLSLTRNFN
jgi:iron complex outermembrane receptor protein